MAIKLSSDHFRIKGIAKRNKREIIGPRKFAKYGHGVAKRSSSQTNAELMHAAEAGEINPTCSGVRRRGMLVRHSKGCAVHCWRARILYGVGTTPLLNPPSSHCTPLLQGHTEARRKLSLLTRKQKAKSSGREMTPCFGSI